MAVDGAGCGGSGSLVSQGERGEDRSSHKGPRDGTLEPWVQILTSSPSPQFPAYTLEVVTLPTRGQLGSWQLPCPNPWKLPIMPSMLVSPSLALSMCSLATSGPPCYPLFLFGMCATPP